MLLSLLLVLGIFKKGQAALVQTQHTVMAAAGEDAHLSCQLKEEVQNVTWWKLSAEGEKNVATSTKYFGPSVNPDFRDKVEFKDAGLQNSSIVIMNVTEQDESCYHCSYNTDHEGVLNGTTCLKVYVPQHLHLSNFSSVNVTDTNSTVTANSIAVPNSIWIVGGVVLVCGIVAALVFFLRKRENQNRDNEMNEKVEATINHRNEVQPPLVDQEEIRQLTAEENQTEED